jgi:hypothetical protein
MRSPLNWGLWIRGVHYTIRERRYLMQNMCYKCDKTKDIEEFHKDRSRKYGYSHICKECDYEKRTKNLVLDKAARREVRIKEGRGTKYSDKTKERIKEIKSVPCSDCKGVFPPFCMDFDHRDPSNKKFNIASWRAHSAFEVVEEIAKCDVVCSNCHRIRTWGKHEEVEITEFDT